MGKESEYGVCEWGIRVAPKGEFRWISLLSTIWMKFPGPTCGFT